MSLLQDAGLYMAPVYLLVSPNESPTRRRACIVVGRELRKVADDFEASYEATRMERREGEKKIVAEAMKTVCVFAGLVLLGRAVWKLINN